MEVIVSDGAPGLVKSIQALYPRIKRQRCTFHKAIDLSYHLVQKRHYYAIKIDAPHLFEVTTESEARIRLRGFIDKLKEKEPKAVRNFQRNLDSCFIF